MVNVTTRKPEDFGISIENGNCREFIEICASSWRISNNKPSIIWEGEGIEEVGRRSDTNEVVVRIDPRYFRPTGINFLVIPLKLYKTGLETKN